MIEHPCFIFSTPVTAITSESWEVMKVLLPLSAHAMELCTFQHFNKWFMINATAWFVYAVYESFTPEQCLIVEGEYQELKYRWRFNSNWHFRILAKFVKTRTVHRRASSWKWKDCCFNIFVPKWQVAKLLILIFIWRSL